MSALRWENATNYYRISIQQDLLGGLSLCCTSGAKNGRRPRTKLVPCDSLGDLRRQVRLLAREYRRKGCRFSPKHSSPQRP